MEFTVHRDTDDRYMPQRHENWQLAQDTIGVARLRPLNGNHKERLPDFFIVGAAKSATTWLTVCLATHPSVFLPMHEPHYFSVKYDPRDPVPQSYSRLFAPAKSSQCIGENSNTYMIDPGVPARIYSLIPNARIIACLRNPVDRAYSDYCMHYRTGRVSSDISKYLDPEHSVKPLFLEAGLYYLHLTRYMQHFTADQLLVCLHEDIATEPCGVLTSAAEFLGISNGEQHLHVSTRVNASSQGDVPVWIRKAMSRVPCSQVAMSLFRRAGLSSQVRNVLRRPVTYPPLPSKLQDRMKEYFRDDVEQLSNLIRRDLTAWGSHK